MKTKQERQRKAFILELYQKNYDLVRKKILNITRDENNIDDLISDTFVKLMEKEALLQTLGDASQTAYVVYTARSVAINFIKRRHIQQRHLFYSDEMELMATMASAEELVLKREELNQLEQAILALPEKQRSLLYFKYMLGLSDTEIAEIFNIAPASVRQYLTRARRATIALFQGGDTDDQCE